jgi:hypothetical protein
MNTNLVVGPRRGHKPRTTLLARVISKLLDLEYELGQNYSRLEASGRGLIEVLSLK